jgi:hypothetical protein
MSYASSTANTSNQLVSWTFGQPADGIALTIQGLAQDLTTGVTVSEEFNLGIGIWFLASTITVIVNDATTDWEPSLFAFEDEENNLLGGTSICGLNTYANGQHIYQNLSMFTTSSNTQTNPFSVRFTPIFANETVAPTASFFVQLVKIR